MSTHHTVLSALYTISDYRRGFRRRGGDIGGLINIAVVACVGVVSGHYIFKDPLEDYWREKNQENAEKKQAPASGAANNTAASAAAPAPKA